MQSVFCEVWYEIGENREKHTRKVVFQQYLEKYRTECAQIFTNILTFNCASNDMRISKFKILKFFSTNIRRHRTPPAGRSGISHMLIFYLLVKGYQP